MTMTTFALIHGGPHAGWCWELVVRELETRGPSTITPDLSLEDPVELADVVAKL
jgi:hypothetical protein